MAYPPSVYDTIKLLSDGLRELQDENERLRTALEWYANAKMFEWDNDRGEKARDALRAKQEKTQ